MKISHCSHAHGSKINHTAISKYHKASVKMMMQCIYGGDLKEKEENYMKPIINL